MASHGVRNRHDITTSSVVGFLGSGTQELHSACSLPLVNESSPTRACLVLSTCSAVVLAAGPAVVLAALVPAVVFTVVLFAAVLAVVSLAGILVVVRLVALTSPSLLPPWHWCAHSRCFPLGHNHF
ncbi:hypothetical protein GN244_ATG19345 [Phytophthora infestans]|uniref:Transmembrane protein n=1 Tax=Phytophthora infestans TaxID=4787 RepID=A0A833W463_PHYIN|nr:hypothetical protein GN244_ATG19345 [Phytophthora infestans]KAF4150404.1 hypothetical protein GN958_ATG00402 [Phytophthora infestans]